MRAPQYRKAVPEASLDGEGRQKTPDYTFCVGATPKFYVEAKKCGVNINEDPLPAYQLRRYGFSARLPLSRKREHIDLLYLQDQTTLAGNHDRHSFQRGNNRGDQGRTRLDLR
jgi:hypothetical protein